MATIIIPTPLRKFTDNKAKIITSGKSVGESISEIGMLRLYKMKKHQLKRVM
jgi:hypothetical protein